VFKAWTKPGLISQWLFKSRNNWIVVAHQELSIGGKFSILETTVENEQIDHYGTYLAIAPAVRLSFTLEVPWHFEGVTAVSISFINDKAGNCLMDFQQSGIDPRNCTSQLEGYVRSAKRYINKG